MVDERLEALRGQPKEALAALLAELAATHPEVEERLIRHALAGDPAQLAAEFRKRLQNWFSAVKSRCPIEAGRLRRARGWST